jgi:hypothetical protein
LLGYEYNMSTVEYSRVQQSTSRVW